MLAVVLIKLAFLAVFLVPLLYVIYRVRGRNGKDVLIFFSSVGLYVFLYRKFVFGKEYVFHDSMWDHHAFYAILKQWIENGYSIGWNPFLNGGEPLYIYSNFFLWAELIAFIFVNKMFAIPTHQLLNLYFTFILISFSAFCFILLTFVFRDRLVGFYMLVPVLFGGLTISMFGQYVLSPLYLLPLAFLSAYLFVRDRRAIDLLWVLFFISVSANHYLPHYLVISVGAFLLCSIGVGAASHLFSRALPSSNAVTGGRRVGRGKTVITRTILIAFLSAAVLAPAVFVYLEVRDRISPTRGNVTLGEGGMGLQPGVYLAPAQYQYLIYIPQIEPALATWENLAYNHSVFYIGWIPLVLAVYSLVLLREEMYLYFLSSLLLLGFIALGDYSFIWVFLKEHAPFFYLRHAYPLALSVTLLIVTLSAFGFQRVPLSQGWKLLVVGLALVFSVYETTRVPFGDSRHKRPFELRPFAYPSERWPYSRPLAEVPLDSEPIISKRAVATHVNNDFILFRSRPYHDLLLRDLPFVSGKLFTFSRSLEFPQLALNNVRNELENGSFENWAVQTGGQANGRIVPRGFSFQWEGEVPKLEENRKPEWILDGRSSALIGLPIGSRAVVSYTYPDVKSVRDRFLAFSACLNGPNRQPVAVGLVIYQEGGRNILTPHTYKKTEGWGCLLRTFQVAADAEGLAVSVALSAEGETVVYMDRLELKVIPEGMLGRNVEIPVEFVNNRDPDHLVIRVNVAEDGYLVRKENYHKGWSVRVDGVPTPIERFGGVFQAVKVGKGSHTVEFRFRSAYNSLMWIHFAAVMLGYIWFYRELIRTAERQVGYVISNG